MRKKIIWSAVVLLFIAALIELFFLPRHKADNAILSIPKDAAMVWSVNPQSLSEKADMEKVKKLNFWKKLGDLYGEAKSDEDKTLIREIMNDPSKTGIDLRNNVYYFYMNRHEELQMGMVFCMGDEKSWQSFLEKSGSEKVEETNGYKWVKLNESSLAGWDSKRIVVIFDGHGIPGRDLLTDCMKLDRSASFASNSFYKSFDEKNSDLWLMISYDQFGKAANNFRLASYSSSNSDSPFDLKNMYLGLSFNFEKDKMTMHYNVYSEDAFFNRMMAMISGDGLDNEQIRCLTNGKLLGLFSVCFKMDEVFKVMNDNFTGRKALEEIKEQSGLSDKELKNLFTGKLVCSMTDIRNTPVTHTKYEWDDETESLSSREVTEDQLIPLFIMSIGIDDHDALHKLLRAAKLDKNDGIYTLDIPLLKIFICEDDGGITITNDEPTAKELASKKHFSKEPSEDIKKMIKEYPASFYLDLNPDHYSSDVLDKLKDTYGDDDFDRIKNIFSLFTDMRAYGRTDGTTFEVNLKKGEGNSLYRILEALDKNVPWDRMNHEDDDTNDTAAYRRDSINEK